MLPRRAHQFQNDAHMEELHISIIIIIFIFFIIACSSSSLSSPREGLHRAPRVHPHRRVSRGARRVQSAQPAALRGSVRVPAAARARAGVRHAVPDEAHRGADALLHRSRAHR